MQVLSALEGGQYAWSRLHSQWRQMLQWEKLTVGKPWKLQPCRTLNSVATYIISTEAEVIYLRIEIQNHQAAHDPVTCYFTWETFRLPRNSTFKVINFRESSSAPQKPALKNKFMIYLKYNSWIHLIHAFHDLKNVGRVHNQQRV